MDGSVPEGLFDETELELLQEKARYRAHKRRMFEKHSKGGAARKKVDRKHDDAARQAIPYRGPAPPALQWADVPCPPHRCDRHLHLADRSSLVGKGICIALPLQEGRSSRDKGAGGRPASSGSAYSRCSARGDDGDEETADAGAHGVFGKTLRTASLITEAVALRTHKRYECLFSTARVPGADVDRVVRHTTPTTDGPLDKDDLPTWVNVPYAVFLYRGHMWKADVWDPKLDRPVHPVQVREILDEICGAAPGAAPTANPLPITLLSAKPREDVAATMLRPKRGRGSSVAAADAGSPAKQALRGGSGADAALKPKHAIHWRERPVLEASYELLQAAQLVVSLSEDRPQTKAEVLAKAGGFDTDKWYGKAVQLVCFANGASAAYLDSAVSTVALAAAFTAELAKNTAARMKDAEECARFWGFLRRMEHEADSRWTCFDLAAFDRVLSDHPAFQSRGALDDVPLTSYRRILLEGRLAPWVETIRDPYDASTVWFYNPTRHHAVYHKDAGFIEPLRGRPSEWLWAPAVTPLPGVTLLEHPSVLKEMYLFLASAKLWLTKSEAEVTVVKFEEVGTEMLKNRRAHPDTFMAFALQYACYTLQCGEEVNGHSHMFINSVSGADPQSFAYGTASEVSGSTYSPARSKPGRPPSRSAGGTSAVSISAPTTPATTVFSAHGDHHDGTRPSTRGSEGKSAGGGGRPTTATTAVSAFETDSVPRSRPGSGGSRASGTGRITFAALPTPGDAAAGRPQTAGVVSPVGTPLCGILRPGTAAAVPRPGASAQLMFAPQPMLPERADTLGLSETVDPEEEEEEAEEGEEGGDNVDRCCMFGNAKVTAMCEKLYHGGVGVHPSKRNAYRAAVLPIAAFLRNAVPDAEDAPTAAYTPGQHPVYLATTGISPDSVMLVGSVLAQRFNENATVRATYKAFPHYVEVAVAAPPTVIKPLLVHIRAAIRAVRDVLAERKKKTMLT